VLAERPEGSPRACAAERQLREATLRLGALLDWSADEVSAFAAALTGRPWSDCGAAELWRVLTEYERLAGALVARTARPRRNRGKGRGDAARA
jgi:hypothetical protein